MDPRPPARQGGRRGERRARRARLGVGQDGFVETTWAYIRAARGRTSLRGGSVGLWLMLGSMTNGSVAGVMGLMVET